MPTQFPLAVRSFNSMDGRDEMISEITALEAAGIVNEQRLASVPLVNLNTATAVTLYTVPAGKSCIPTRFIIRLASTNLTTVSFSIGWTGATYNDLVADATHTELTGNTLYTILIPKVGALVGTAASVMKLLDNILQGGAATATVDVYGILF